jgi:hypothetical protein
MATSMKDPFTSSHDERIWQWMQRLSLAVFVGLYLALVSGVLLNEDRSATILAYVLHNQVSLL